jgi:hypothetical protein
MPAVAAASAGPSAFWYLTRGTGAIALVLLALSVALVHITTLDAARAAAVGTLSVRPRPHA